MNERIKELLEQATEVYDQWHRGESVCMVDYKMFAELIVRECIRCCDDIEVIQKHYLKYGINQELGAGQCIEVIKKHFGVSE